MIRFRPAIQCLMPMLMTVIIWSSASLEATAQPGSLAVVSAASFAQGVPQAPNSIVAVFGQNLAAGVFIAGAGPLPETLGGVSVVFRDANNLERSARLFFVSPGQINCVIPGDLASGAATIEVRSGMMQIASGSLQLSAAAPAIFTARSDGTGVPAAGLIRLLPDGQQVEEAPFQVVDNTFVPRPIDLSSETERIFLVLYPTGVRGGQDVRVIIGGLERTPLYAGPQNFFEGLDQINVEIPRSLYDPSAAGNKEIVVRIYVPNFGESNEVVLQVGRPDRPPVTVNNVTAMLPLLARSEIQLEGIGFSEDKAKNKVNFGVEIGEIRSATSTSLSVLVPFGVRSGLIELNSDGKEWKSPSLNVRTSMSGLALDQNQQPMSGLRVCRPVTVNNELRCPDAGAVTPVQPEGWFVLPDAPTGGRVVFLMENIVQSGLSIPPVTFSLPVMAERDNRYPKTIDLTAASGPSATFGSGFAPGSAGGVTNAAAPGIAAQGVGFRLAIDDFIFTVPAGATAMFPNGATGGVVTLTPIRNGRTPVPFPDNVYSQTLAQISPFGVKIAPGGKLILPNADLLPDGSQPNLFRYDFATGTFIDTGIKTTVTGTQIITPDGAITETGIFFAAIARPTTTIIGRVVESDGVTPVRGAIVSARGRQSITDGNGGFILTQVPAEPGERIEVTVIYLRPSGRTDRASRLTEPVEPGWLTRLVDNGQVVPLRLPSNIANRPPTLTAPTYQSIYANESREIQLALGDLDEGQGLPSLQLDGAGFASLLNTGTNAPTLRLAPGNGDVGKQALVLTATDAAGASTAVTIIVDIKPLPTATQLSVMTNEDTPVAVTLGGSDVENRSLVFTLTSSPQHGALIGTPPNLTYTPQTDFNGADSFTYKVGNGIVESAPATVSLTIIPVNDPPMLTLSCPPAVTVLVNQLVSCTASATDPDAGQIITLAAQNLPTGASFSPSSGIFTWTPGAMQTGVFTVTFTATDNGVPPLNASRQLSITVESPPMARWVLQGNLQKSRGGHTGTLLADGRVLITGGITSEVPDISGIPFIKGSELYNPATGLWAFSGDFALDHAYHTATLLEGGQYPGHVLVVGGEGRNFNPVSPQTVERYDPGTGQWTRVADTLHPHIRHTATRLANGMVLVVGGEYETVSNKTEIYDPNADVWVPAGDINAARVDHTATLLPNGRVLVAGGSSSSAALNTAEIFNPATGEWTPTQPLNQARTRHTATLLEDGRVLLVGGEGLFTGMTAEIYDPLTGVWTPTAPMHVARQLHTATLLTDGRVLVAGGVGGTTPFLKQAEIYDPTTGQWTETADMNDTRAVFTATRLLDGRVLAAGGDVGTTTRASSELYTPGEELLQPTGSILLFPYYGSNAINPNNENTTISFTNTNTESNVFLSLFFVRGSDGDTGDVSLIVEIGAGETASFQTSEVDPGTSGYLIVVAVGINGCPISFNFLRGSAAITLPSGHNLTLPAQTIQALNAPTSNQCTPGEMANLVFDGTTYERLARRLVADQVRSNGDNYDTRLAVNRLGASLAAPLSPLGSLSGLLYDQANTPYAFSANPMTPQLFSQLTSSFPLTNPIFPTALPAGQTGKLDLRAASESVAVFGAIFDFKTGTGSSGALLRATETLPSLTIPMRATPPPQ